MKFCVCYPISLSPFQQSALISVYVVNDKVVGDGKDFTPVESCAQGQCNMKLHPFRFCNTYSILASETSEIVDPK